MDKAFTFKASKEFMLALDEAAWALRENMSDVLREGVLKYIEENKHKMPEESRSKIEKWLKDATEFKEEGE